MSHNTHTYSLTKRKYFKKKDFTNAAQHLFTRWKNKQNNPDRYEQRHIFDIKQISQFYELYNKYDSRCKSYLNMIMTDMTNQFFQYMTEYTSTDIDLENLLESNAHMNNELLKHTKENNNKDLTIKGMFKRISLAFSLKYFQLTEGNFNKEELHIYEKRLNTNAQNDFIDKNIQSNSENYYRNLWILLPNYDTVMDNDIVYEEHLMKIVYNICNKISKISNDKKEDFYNGVGKYLIKTFTLVEPPKYVNSFDFVDLAQNIWRNLPYDKYVMSIKSKYLSNLVPNVEINNLNLDEQVELIYSILTQYMPGIMDLSTISVESIKEGIMNWDHNYPITMGSLFYMLGNFATVEAFNNEFMNKHHRNIVLVKHEQCIEFLTPDDVKEPLQTKIDETLHDDKEIEQEGIEPTLSETEKYEDKPIQLDIKVTPKSKKVHESIVNHSTMWEALGTSLFAASYAMFEIPGVATTAYVSGLGVVSIAAAPVAAVLGVLSISSFIANMTLTDNTDSHSNHIKVEEDEDIKQ